MGLVSDPDKLKGLEEADRKRRDAALAKSNSALSDEIRVCTRCGWKAAKSVCLAQGIRACPNCGNTECRGMSMDFQPEMFNLGRRPQG
jgi:hypothetical protein